MPDRSSIVHLPIPAISRQGSGRGCPLLRASNDQHSSNRSFQARLLFLSWKGIHVGLGAAVERGPPDSSPAPEGVGKPSFTARIERPPLYRGGSASKKDGCLPPRILLRARVPGAQDQRGVSFQFFVVRILRARRVSGHSLLILLRPQVARGRGSGFPAGGQVFESAVAVGKDFDGSEGFDRIQVDTGRDSR